MTTLAAEIPSKLHPQLSNFLEKYVVVCKVADAMTGLTAYCLPHSAIESTKPNDPDSLRKELLAIKIPKYRIIWSKIANEVRIHNKIHTEISAVNTEGSPGIPQIIDFDQRTWNKQDPSKSTVSWFVMEAVVPSIPLMCLIREYSLNVERVPDAFMAHVFLELLATVKFLHQVCDVAHNDIHWNNALVRVQPENSMTQFPRIFLVDFERGVLEESPSGAKAKAIQKDVNDIFSTVARLTTFTMESPKMLSPEDQPDEVLRRWNNQFMVHMWDVVIGQNSAKRKSTLGDVIDAFEGIAKEVKNRADAEEIENFNKEMERIGEEKGINVSDEQLLNAAKMC